MKQTFSADEQQSLFKFHVINLNKQRRRSMYAGSRKNNYTREELFTLIYASSSSLKAKLLQANNYQFDFFSNKIDKFVHYIKHIRKKRNLSLALIVPVTDDDNNIVAYESLTEIRQLHLKDSDDENSVNNNDSSRGDRLVNRNSVSTSVIVNSSTNGSIIGDNKDEKKRKLQSSVIVINEIVSFYSLK
jgi:hypothetical protein